MSSTYGNSSAPYDVGEVIDVNNDPNDGGYNIGEVIDVNNDPRDKITLEEPKVLLIRELGHFTFDGVKYPYQSLKTNRTATVIKHRSPVVDGSINEVLSRPSFTFTLEIPAYNLTYKNIYPKALHQLEICLKNKGFYKLLHPTLGNLLANIESISESNDTEHEDGCLLTVTFVEAVDLTAKKIGDDSGVNIVRIDNLYFKDRDIILIKQIHKDDKKKFKADTDLISTFNKALGDLNAFAGSLDRAQRRGIGKVTSILYACDRTINILSSLVSTNAGYISNFLGVIRGIQSELIRSGILKQSKTESIQTKTYLVPKDMSVVTLLKRLNITYKVFRKYNNINDNIIKLGTRIIYV